MRPNLTSLRATDLDQTDQTPVTLQQAVCQRLREMLLAGEFEPGSRLQEVGLAKSLGVSRTPLRAALTLLGQEGLITYNPNCGYEVRRVTIAEILETYDVRGTLEGMACRLCTERGLDDDSRLLLVGYLAEGAAIVSGACSADETFGRWRKMNLAFHEVIMRGSGNQCLRELTKRTLSFPFVSQIVGRWRGPRNYQQAQQMHQLIFDAMMARQSARVEALMREHVVQSKDVVRQILAEIRSGKSESAVAAKFDHEP